MNVAIVTQPIKANYGGVLQNFALQCVLRKLGHHPVTIDYRDSSPLWFYLFQTIKTILLYPFSSKRRALTPYRNVFPRDKRIMKFVHKYIKLTDNQYLSYNRDIIQKYKIGAVIVGSDQVWRPRYSPNCLYDTYLSFLKNEKLIKISYAASFGVDSWEYTDKQTKVCKELMKQFNAVSVREHSGVHLCQKYLDVKACEVLDPTLLLSSDDYCSVCSDIPVNRKRYVCCYMLDASSEKMIIIEEFSRKNNCEIIVFSAHDSIMYSVEEWLALFRDASFVITDSFHGTVFSIIFHREFYSLINADRGATRFVSLLSKFGLESRIVVNKKLENVPIDWTIVDSKKNEMINKSINYLRNGLS